MTITNDGHNKMIAYGLEDPLYHTNVANKQRFWKRMLIVDDDADIIMTFREVIEDSNNRNSVNKKIATTLRFMLEVDVLGTRYEIFHHHISCC
ncbi:MAG: hypothetical protein WA364_17350 [Candidatus Nitrosopolaris sp.]